MSGDLGSSRSGHAEELDELAVGWALHALEPEDEAAFAGHLADCARCARTVAETHEVMAAMASDLPPVEPSPGLRDRLRAAVEQTEQVIRPAGPVFDELADDVDLSRLTRRERPLASSVPAATGPGRSGRRRRASLDRPTWRRAVPNAIAAAAVAAALVVGTWNVILVQDRNNAQATVAEQADVMSSLLMPGQASIAPLDDADGHNVATVVARDGQVQVVTNGMGVNDRSDSTYVVWGMTEGTPVALGTFDVVTAGLDLRTVGSETTGLNDYTKYGISLEQGRQAPSTPGAIVASGQVSS